VEQSGRGFDVGETSPTADGAAFAAQIQARRPVTSPRCLHRARGCAPIAREKTGARRGSGRGSRCYRQGPYWRGLAVIKQPPGNGVMVKLLSS
jgi:hypothetical protein